MFAAAMTHHHAGALAKAERQYRQILDLSPQHADARSRLGAVLMALGKTNEAITHLERAVALKPGLFEAYANLAQAHAAAGDMESAIHAMSYALEIKETPQGKALFALYVKAARFKSDEGGRIQKVVLRALTEGWGPPRVLTSVCTSLLKLNAVLNACIERANSAWPARLPATELFGQPGLAALADHQLLRNLLECDPIADVGIERLLTNVRSLMLSLANCEDQTVSGRDLQFYGAVARQCFLNEYIYALPQAEAEQAAALQSALAERLTTGEPIPALWPIVIAAYFPLHRLSNAEALCQRPWPDCVEALIVQQIKEPAEERRIAASIPSLTKIVGEVSLAVRQQYEENPYPRWVKMGPPERSLSPRDRPQQSRPDILIAGCGTGLSIVEFARLMGNIRVLAVDLSLASMSYAKRMVQKLGLTDIEFAQADILNLGSLRRDFDFIDSSGVLHHLADPWAGWRVLLSLLRPGGTMQVGLYSDLARRNVVAARALIQARGYQPILPDIRRCREDIIQTDDTLLRSLTLSGDFFTTSECRDLLFHVQEHRITIPQIKSFLNENNLSFTGFILDAAALRAFSARFPGRAALTDLDRWHEFEMEAPNTFAAMYGFQVQKPPMPPAGAAPRSG